MTSEIPSPVTEAEHKSKRSKRGSSIVKENKTFLTNNPT